jgi:hypothetical protein
MRLIRDGGDEERLADATREATRAMWQTVLLGRERRARKRLFERVRELVRARQPR